jgi:superfamily II DNA or RNA helicase
MKAKLAQTEERSRLIGIQEFQEFSLVRDVKPTEINPTVLDTVRSLDEVDELEPYIRKIISDFNETPHGPTELVDIFTHHLTFRNKPQLAAFILKGRSFKTVRAKDVGHQIYRLEKIPSLDVAVFAAAGTVLDPAKEQFVSTAQRVASQYCIVDATDLARIFIAYGFVCPRDGHRITAGRCVCGYSPAKRILNIFQNETLKALDDSHRRREPAGLVVLPPGSGKTRVAAEDALKFGAQCILYVAHTHEILDVAQSEFAAKFGDASVTEHESRESLKTLNRVNLVTTQLLQKYVRTLDVAAIDYAIVDEFHHAPARTYRTIINAIRPRFLLGLTATPYRGDNQDVLALCHGNQLVEFDLRKGMNAGILSPYHYYGCFDNIDYSAIKLNNTRYDIGDLERALLIPARDEAIIQKWRQLADGKATLAFCCSHDHAWRMASSFCTAGIPAATYISSTPPEERAMLLDRLAAGEVSVLCVVDVFNEGADLPFIECLLFLRPTESKRILYQQLGRGLRQYVGKRQCIAIDFIGNFRNAYRIVEYLGLEPLENDPESLLRIAQAKKRKDVLNLPLGCEVDFEDRLIDLFARQASYFERANRHNIRGILLFQYERLEKNIGRRPTRADVKRSCLLGVEFYVLAFGSWARFERFVEEYNN